MSGFDHLDIDGRLLQLLVAVLEEGSVTRAAVRLGVTQSAVSHLLDKLRVIVGDPLFVRSGRGIAATPRAEALAQHARLLLDGLRSFSQAPSFDPAQARGTVGIAANELQRDLLLPRLFRRLRQAAPGLGLRITASDVPSLELLRDESCQLVISPRPPDGGDVLQKRLFEDHYRVFYDPAERDAPADRAAYEAAEHVTVRHEGRKSLEIDTVLAERGVVRRFAVVVGDFSGVRPFLRGGALLATLPRLLGVDQLHGLAHAEVPLPCPPLPMYMLWHQRHHADPLQQWLRRELEAVVAPALGAADAG